MRLLLTALFPFVGCATAQVTGYRDPVLASFSYNNVAIYYPSSDLETRARVENEIASEFGLRSISSGATAAVISPTEQVSALEFNTRLKKANFDSLLMITESTASSSSTYVPGYAVSNSSGFYYNPGQTITTVGAKSNVTLIDLTVGKVAWVGTVSGTGWSLDDIIPAMAGKVVGRLVDEGVVASTAVEKRPVTIVGRRDPASLKLVRHKILVFHSSADLDERKLVESEGSRALQERGVSAKAAFEIVSAELSQDAEALAKHVLTLPYEAVVFISNANSIRTLSNEIESRAEVSVIDMKPAKKPIWQGSLSSTGPTLKSVASRMADALADHLVSEKVVAPFPSKAPTVSK